MVTITVNSGEVKIVNFGNRLPVPPPEDVIIPQQYSTQNGIPTILRPNLHILTIQKNLSSLPNVIAVNLTMNWSDGTSIQEDMIKNISTDMWEARIDQPYSWGFPSGTAQMRFEVDVSPAGNWPGPEDALQIGDIIFIDSSGQIRSACTNATISG